MWPFFASIAFVLVFDPVAEGVFGTRELPGEDIRAVGRVCDCRRISSERRLRAVKTHQPVLAPNLPVAVGRVAVVEDLGEQPFGPRSIVGCRSHFLHRNQILRAGQDENVFGFVVTGHAFGGLAADAGNAQIPAEPERAVAVAGAVDEIELRLETIAARRQRNGNREIAGPGVEGDLARTSRRSRVGHLPLSVRRSHHLNLNSPLSSLRRLRRDAIIRRPEFLTSDSAIISTANTRS